jgi:hypothetical protein
VADLEFHLRLSFPEGVGSEVELLPRLWRCSKSSPVAYSKVDEPILDGIRNYHTLKEGIFYDNIFHMLAFEIEIHLVVL